MSSTHIFLVLNLSFDVHSDAPGDAPSVGRIILYKNGFMLGEENSEFFYVKDPKNAAIVNALIEG